MPPTFTFAIPTHREDRPLKRCLESVKYQLEAGDEVLVIGDTFNGELPAVQSLVEGYGAQFRYLPYDAGHSCWGHCVTPDTALESADARRVFRRRYCGPAIDLSGRFGRLTITPNHPVLTERGWIKAGEIQEGDYLVRAPFGQIGTSREPDVQRQPAVAAEIFDTLRKFGLSHRVPGLRMQFHGDRSDSEVDVVRADRLLGNGNKAALLQPAEHLPFASTQLLRPYALTRDSLPRELLGRVAVDSALSYAGGSHGTPFVGSHSSRAQSLPITVRTQRDAFLNQPMANSLTADPEFFGQHPNGHAFQVTLDQVSHIRRFAYDGHVYNLETRSNWYLANGCIVHNCQLNYAMSVAKGQYWHVNDDDDVYLPGATEMMRQAANAWPGRLLMFRFISQFGTIYWEQVGKVERNSIGGHCLVAPLISSKMGMFACVYSGDYDYVAHTVAMFGGPREAIWIDNIICRARPNG